MRLDTATALAAANPDATSVPWYAWLAFIAALFGVIAYAIRTSTRTRRGHRDDVRHRLRNAEADAVVHDYTARRMTELADDRLDDRRADQRRRALEHRDDPDTR